MTKYEALKKYFGYDSYREGQDILVDGILSGRDVMGIMPTGAGKSICYQIPALLFHLKDRVYHEGFSFQLFNCRVRPALLLLSAHFR